MKPSSFRYLLKEGLRNLWRNRIMSLTSIGVLTTCLLIVGAAFLLTVNVNSMVQYVEGQSEMCVYMVDGLSDEELSAAENEISAAPNVTEVTFVSAEEGLANTKRQLGDESYLLDGYEGETNPIPDSFVVKIDDISKTRDTQAALKEISGVDVVNASGEVADTLTYIQDTVGTMGTIIIIALAVISLVIIANTIRATIFTRRKEINIMKFVGARNSFIRIPFVIEGFALGLIAALIAFLAIWAGYSYLIGAFTDGMSSYWLQSAFDSVVPFTAIAPWLALFFAGTGTVLGVLGSLVSIRNHVKV